MSNHLDKFLKKKVLLRRKKYTLAIKFYSRNQHYLLAYGSISSLMLVILKEKSVNKHVLKELRKIHKEHLQVMPLMNDLQTHSSKLGLILDDESKILREISLHPVSPKNFSVLVSKKKTLFFLRERLQRFKNKLEEEEDVNKKFVESINNHTEKLALKIPGLSEKHRELSETRKLLNILQALYGRVLYEIDPNKAKKEALEILTIINKLRKTELYGYLHSDFEIIRKRMTQIVKNPKENKLATVLAGAYIIAPGTFELTFAILMARYAGKYAKGRFTKKRFFKKAS